MHLNSTLLASRSAEASWRNIAITLLDLPDREQSLLCAGETLLGAGCDGRFLTAITRAARLASPDRRQQFGQGYYLKTEFVSQQTGGVERQLHTASKRKVINAGTAFAGEKPPSREFCSRLDSARTPRIVTTSMPGF